MFDRPDYRLNLVGFLAATREIKKKNRWVTKNNSDEGADCSSINESMTDSSDGQCYHHFSFHGIKRPLQVRPPDWNLFIPAHYWTTSLSRCQTVYWGSKPSTSFKMTWNRWCSGSVVNTDAILVSSEWLLVSCSTAVLLRCPFRR